MAPNLNPPSRVQNTSSIPPEVGLTFASASWRSHNSCPRQQGSFSSPRSANDLATDPPSIHLKSSADAKRHTPDCRLRKHRQIPTSTLNPAPNPAQNPLDPPPGRTGPPSSAHLTPVQQFLDRIQSIRFAFYWFFGTMSMRQRKRNHE